MKVKNVKLFRRRAKAHADAGHISQGTYGRGDVNGKVEYQGCAVACLAAPHQKRELRQFVKDQLKKIRHPEISNGLKELEFSGSRHKRQLSEEFGLTPELLTLLEGLFEAQRTHGAAINLIPAFANALHEGADIKPAAVQRFAQQELGLVKKKLVRHPWRGLEWEEQPLKLNRTNWTSVMSQVREGNVPAQTRKFLAWVEAQTA